jgi:hypothetical protein
MTIHYHSDETESSTSPVELEAVQNSLASLDRTIHGCIHVLSDIVEICAKVDVSDLTAEIEVKVFGKTVFEGKVSSANPCLSVDLNPHIHGLGFELKFDVCLDIEKRCVTVDGKACVKYIIKKSCAHLHKHCIVHF